MTVYVDNMYLYPMGRFGRMKMSHMWSPDTEELHRMADTIGLQRKWYQAKASTPHYDVSMSLRGNAIKAGAVDVSMEQMARMIREHRNKCR